jgi:hypothetical protein
MKTCPLCHKPSSRIIKHVVEAHPDEAAHQEALKGKLPLRPEFTSSGV